MGSKLYFFSCLVICLTCIKIAESSPWRDERSDSEMERDFEPPSEDEKVFRETRGTKKKKISQSSDVGNQDTMTAGGQDWQKAALDAMNYYREEHGAPELEMTKKLNQQAQKFADKIAASNVLEHSCKKPCAYGENVGYSTGKTNWADSARSRVKSWNDEEKFYDYKNPQFGSKSGHFTQLVWKGSKYVGIGMAKNPKSGRLFIVAQYEPKGNMKNKFKKNVLPKRF